MNAGMFYDLTGHLLIPPVQVQGQRSHMWVGLVLGVLVATVVGLLLSVLAHHQGKDMQFG